MRFTRESPRLFLETKPKASSMEPPHRRVKSFVISAPSLRESLNLIGHGTPCPYDDPKGKLVQRLTFGATSGQCWVDMLLRNSICNLRLLDILPNGNSICLLKQTRMNWPYGSWIGYRHELKLLLHELHLWCIKNGGKRHLFAAIFVAYNIYFLLVLTLSTDEYAP